MVNVPLSSTARLRVSAFYEDQKPLITNLGGSGAIGQRSYGVNAKLALDFTDSLTFLLASTYSHADSSYGQFTAIGPGLFGSAAQALTHVPYGRGVTTINDNTPATYVPESASVTGTLNWRLSDTLSLTSISNFTRFIEDNDQDADATPAGSTVPTGYGIPGSTYPFQYLSVYNARGHVPNFYNYYSEELRVNFTSGPFNAVFGAYAQRVAIRYRNSGPDYFDGSLIGQTPGVGYYRSSDVYVNIKDTTASAFGDLTYAVTNQIKLFGGLRYANEGFGELYDRNTFLGPIANFNPVTGIFSGAPAAVYDTASDHTINNLSGRAGIQFEPTTNTNFYASFARGYKGPAGNTGTGLLVGRDPILKPEIATDYEIGAKLRLFDNRLALNGAIFHEVINDIQATVFDPTQKTITFLLLNAGELRTKGFEGDATWAITPEYTIHGGVAYDDASYSGFSVACNVTQTSTHTCPNSGGVASVQNASGYPAAGSPKWKYSISNNYESNLGGTGLSYYGMVGWTWNSAIQYQLDNDPHTLEPSHGSLDASIGLKGPSDRWGVQLFGKNLTNQFYYAYLLNASTIGLPVGFLPRDFQRYGGVRIYSRF
jgi:iron complex outermembrane receptor protein